MTWAIFMHVPYTSTTGINIRKVLLLTEKSHVQNLNTFDFKSVKCHQYEDAEKWRVYKSSLTLSLGNFVLHLLKTKSNSVLELTIGEI